MNRFDKFLPNFMKQFNHYLLLNKPNLWATRVHMVVFLGLFFSLILVGIFFLLPMNYWVRSEITTYISFVSIFSVISLIIWLIYLFRFNPFKRFADDATVRKTGSALVEFGSYWLAISMFVIWPFIPPAIESYRTYRQISANEVAEDVNELNFKIATLEFNQSVMEFTADTVVFYAKENNYVGQSDGVYGESPAVSPYSYYHIKSQKEIIMASDSSLQLNDSMYVLFNAPRLNFVAASELDKVAKTKQNTAFEIWNLAKEAQSVGLNRVQYYSDIVRICKKYNKDWVETDYQGIPRNQLRVASFQDIESKYDTYQIAYMIQGIGSRMTRWLPDMLFLYGHVLFYIASILSMAIFAFRHCTTKLYFVSYLTAFLLVAITSLVIAMSDLHSSVSILIVILVYFLVFLSVSFTVFYTKNRNNIQIIATNISLFVFPFVPYFITLLYLTIKQDGTIGEEYERISEQMTGCILFCEAAGALLLLVVIEFVYKNIYAQWLSMPEE